jgi:hypothetical protein
MGASCAFVSPFGGVDVDVAIAVVDAVEDTFELEVWVIKFEVEEVLWLVHTCQPLSREC